MFLPDQSSAKTDSYCFAYQIEIVNQSTDTVQLLRRHWDIFDGHGQQRVVMGDGVIGKQPVLAPGERHSYVSGSVLPTSIGKMEGFYTFLRISDEQEFEVEIPPFLLVAPYVLN